MKGFVLALILLAGLAPALRGKGPAAASLEEILSRYYQARGGLDKLRALKGCRMSGTITLAEEGLTLPLVVWRKRPDRLRVETTLAGQTSIQAFDGRQAWWLVPALAAEARAMPPERERFFRRQSRFADPLVSWKEAGSRLELLDGEADGGGSALKLTAANGREVLFAIDAASGLLRASALPGNAGAEGAAEVLYGDWRPVDGLQMPFAIENRAGGRTRVRIVLDAVQIDPPLPESLFAMPAGAEAPADAKPGKPGKKAKPKKNSGAPRGASGRSS